jgi:hypothetical protein
MEIMKRHPSLTGSKFAYMDQEWISLGKSARIEAEGDFAKYEYNFYGEVRRKLPNGYTSPVTIRNRMFQMGTKENGKRRYIYVPSRGEIVVGNSSEAYRFDSIAEASKYMGFDILNCKSRDWLVCMGWRQPYVVGDCKRKSPALAVCNE